MRFIEKPEEEGVVTRYGASGLQSHLSAEGTQIKRRARGPRPVSRLLKLQAKPRASSHHSLSSESCRCLSLMTAFSAVNRA